MIKYLNKFKSLNVAVIGDIILDKYVSGTINRTSPEAPVPVVDVEKEWYTLGGAANTALNIKTLGGTPLLFGVVGKENTILFEKFKEFDINTNGIFITNKMTTLKTRILNKDKHLMRVDREDASPIGKNARELIVRKFKNSGNIDIVIISDYAKGVISKKLFREVAEFCKSKNIDLIVDPRPQNKNFYIGASLITPNRKESGAMANIELWGNENVQSCRYN